MSDLERYPLNLCLIKYAQDIQDIIEIVVFQAFKGLCIVCFRNKGKIVRIKHFLSWKSNKLSTTLFIIQIKFLKSTVLNRALPSFNYSWHEFTMTVPLKEKISIKESVSGVHRVQFSHL